jgi:hypothetical protein
LADLKSVDSVSSWKRLLLTTTVDGKVSVRAIAKTFASGKTEKLVSLLPKTFFFVAMITK